LVIVSLSDLLLTYYLGDTDTGDEALK